MDIGTLSKTLPIVVKFGKWVIEQTEPINAEQLRERMRFRNETVEFEYKFRIRKTKFSDWWKTIDKGLRDVIIPLGEEVEIIGGTYYFRFPTNKLSPTPFKTDRILLDLFSILKQHQEELENNQEVTLSFAINVNSNTFILKEKLDDESTESRTTILVKNKLPEPIFGCIIRLEHFVKDKEISKFEVKRRGTLIQDKIMELGIDASIDSLKCGIDFQEAVPNIDTTKPLSWLNQTKYGAVVNNSIYVTLDLESNDEQRIILYH